MLKRPCLAAIAFAGLAACAHVSPAGVITAARLSPLDTPPGDIAVALSVPEEVQLSEGDAQLFLGFSPEGPEMAPVAVTVNLTVEAGVTGPRPPNPGEAIYVLGIREDAANRLAAAQQQIKALKAADVPGTGTLSVAVTGGCLTGQPERGLTVATWLRSSPEGDFVVLTREAELSDLAPEGAEPRFPMC